MLPIPLFAHAAVEAPAPAAPTVDDDRLKLCLAKAAADSPTALAEANRWAAEATGAARAKPLQCLGQIYTVLLRWPAAEDAFVAAAQAETDLARKAALSGQAGNAALAGGRPDRALAHLDAGLPGATGVPRGEIELDRGRALVALGRNVEAREAFVAAQRDAPDEPLVWLLSATLARRLGDLPAAQQQIEVAAALAPADPEVGLEAGVIAMLGGREAAARKSWQSVVTTAPTSPQAATATDYLAQLGEAPKPAPGR